jgi:3-oxoacyl-[acyl-carrier protein] reductase
MSLAGRVALVTGAAHGIGLAIAQRLVADGAAVVLSDIDETGLQAAVAELGDRTAAALGDVRRPEETDAMAAVAKERFGALDIVVNNAGLVAGKTIETMTDAEWDLVLDVILRGTFNVTRSAAPLLMVPAEHHRKVISISSTAGVHGGTTVNYSAAKAGQIGFTKGLAREWAEHQINVNAIAPGRVTGTLIGSPRDGREAKPVRAFEIQQAVPPIGRAGVPEDVAEAVAFLASPASDYMTGQVLEIHGGLEVLPRPK